MKIINLKTNIIFDLPTGEAKKLVNDNSNEFAKVSKNNKILKNKQTKIEDDSILKYILDD